MRASQRRSGSALIEVLVAIVLLVTAGTGLVTLLGQTRHSMRNALQSDRLTHHASEEMQRFVLLDRASLLSRTGRSRSHGFTLDIDALGQGLFAIRIAESDTSGVLLATTVYRPLSDSVNAAQ